MPIVPLLFLLLLPRARIYAQGVSNRPVRLSVSNFFASYSDSGHLGSYLSTQSNENTKVTAFLCLTLINLGSVPHWIYLLMILDAIW